ncbi:MAG: hypothetical protein HY741_01230 [Chloroflexi bacterium]|nr:hypothetical protein [Chloroflexota bacterium]
MKQLQKSWLLFIALFLFLIGVGVAITSLFTLNASDASTITSDAQIIYLAPTSLAISEDVPGSLTALQREGVKVVHDFPTLKQTVESNQSAANDNATKRGRIGAVIVHQHSLSEVDIKWLKSQYDRGTIIAGINIKMSELADLIADPALRAKAKAWPDERYKTPFYSYSGQKSGSWGGVVARGSNNFNPQDGTLQQFVYALRIAMKNLENTP